jgi:hypothetical protein
MLPRKEESMTTTTKSNTVNPKNNLPMSEVIRRKSRMIGSDDLQSAMNLCKWAEQAGFRGPNLVVAESLAPAFEGILELSTRSKHYEAAKKAKSVEYVLKRNDRVQGILVDCRDGRKRKLIQVVSWFADRQFRIAQDIMEAEESEAKVRATAAVADAASKNAERVSTKLQVAKKVA